MFPEMLPPVPPGQVPDMSLVLDYAKNVLDATVRAIEGFAHLVLHPDQLVEAVSVAAHDALVLSAAHMPERVLMAPAPEVGDLFMMRHVIQLHPQIYAEARERMERRVAVVQHIPEMWDQASGPQRAGIVTELAVGLLLPGWTLKGLRAAHALQPFGPFSRPPTYQLPLPPAAANLNRPPPGIRELTVDQFRRAQCDGMFHYVITERGRLILSNHSVTLANGAVIAAYVNHALLAGTEKVLAAGELQGVRGVVTTVNTRAIGIQPPDVGRFEQIVRQVFGNHGFNEATTPLNFFRVDPGPLRPPPMPPGYNYYPILVPQAEAAPPLLRLVGGTDVAERTLGAAASVGGAAPVGGMGVAEGVGVVAAASAIAEAAEVGLAEGLMQQVREAAERIAHRAPHDAHAAEVAARMANHDLQHHPVVPVVPAPPPQTRDPQAERQGVVEAARRVYDVARMVMRDNADFAARNTFLQSMQPQGVLSSYLPNWQNHLNTPSMQAPSKLDIQVRMMSEIRGVTSMSTLEYKIGLAFGGRVSSSDFRSALSSCPGITYTSSNVVSNDWARFTGLSAYGALLASTGLLEDYNSSNSSSRFGAGLLSFGKTGGVEMATALIEGGVGDCDELIIGLKGRKMPFTYRQFEQVARELYVGMFKHGSKPFFSLHFNEKGILYPVLHPCYQNTLVGEILGILDYFMKGFCNGGVYPIEFAKKGMQNTDRAYLKTQLRDLKKMIPGYQSLQEVLCMEGFEGGDDSSYNTMRSAFRIISKLCPLSKQGKVLLAGPFEFDVEYSLYLSPEEEEKRKKERERTGHDPKRYQRLDQVYRDYAETIRTKMPEIPEMKPYFEMLGVMTLICHLYETQLSVHKQPVVKEMPPHATFPDAFPPLPVRRYQTHKIPMTLEMILERSNQADLNSYLYEHFWSEGNTRAPAAREALCRALYGIISAHVGTHNLEQEKLEKLANKHLNSLKDFAIGTGENILSDLVDFHNRVLNNMLPLEESTKRPPLYRELFFNLKELSLLESGEEKWETIQRKKRKAIEALGEYRQQNFQKAQADTRASINVMAAGNPQMHAFMLAKLPAVQEAMRQEYDQGFARMVKDWENAIAETEGELHRMIERIASKSLKESIDEKYHHSLLDFLAAEQDNVRIMGGCGIQLKRVTPTELSPSKELAALSESVAPNGFSSFTYEGERYQGFRIAAQRRSDGMEDEGKYDDEEEGHKISPMRKATLRGDVEALSQALMKEDPNQRQPNELGALEETILSGHEESALRILESGRFHTLNHTSHEGVTVLHMALQLKQQRVALRLIQMGADPTIRRFKNGYTPLHIAVEQRQEEAIVAMKERGADLNLPLPGGRTPLHMAAEAGMDLSFLNFLMKSGARPGQQDLQGNTPLQCAVIAGYRDVALHLAQHTPLDLCNHEGETASIVAARYTMFDVMDLLLKRGEDRKRWSCDRAGRDIPYYIMKHGDLVSFRKYHKQIPNSFWKKQPPFAHGLFLHVLLEKKLLRDVSLLPQMIAVDDGACVFKQREEIEKAPADWLCMAVEQGSRASIGVMLGWMVDYFGNNPMRPLVSAIRGGDLSIFTTILRYAEKKKTTTKTTVDKEGNHLMHYVEEKGIVTKDLMDEEGNRLVHYAVNYGRADIFQKLVRSGHHVNIANRKGETPYDLAKRYDDKEILKILEKNGVTSSLTSPNKSTPPAAKRELRKETVERVMNCLKEGRFQEWKKIVNSYCRRLVDGQPFLVPLLCIDAQFQHNFALRAMKYLAASRYDPFMKDSKGEPAIFALALSCSTVEEVRTKLRWLQESFPEHYQELLAQTNEEGQNLCDLAIRDGCLFVLQALRLNSDQLSEKAFHYACMGGEIETVKHLMQGRSPREGEHYDEKGYTPLHYAALYGHTSVVDLMLTWGVNPRLRNREGNLPLHLAVKEKHIETAHRLINDLSEYMASSDLANRKKQTPFMWAAMGGLASLITRLAPLSNPYAVTETGLTALHLAAGKGSIKGIKQLLKLGIDVNLGSAEVGKEGEEGLTPLYFAAMRGELETFRFLLSQGAELDRVGSDGSTVAEAMVQSNSELMLHEMKNLRLLEQTELQGKIATQAARSGNLKVMQRLCLLPVHLDEYDAKGWAPLHYAVANERHAVVSFLLKHGCNVAQATADGKNTTAETLAKSPSMKELLASFAGQKKVGRALAKKLVENVTHRQGNKAPPPYKRGFTPQECALLERVVANPSPDFYALALRVKREMGIEKFYLLFARKIQSKVSENDVMNTMYYSLGAWSSIVNRFDVQKAWKLPTIVEMNCHLQAIYQKMRKEKSRNDRSAREMIAYFCTPSATVKEPLSKEKAARIGENYRQVIGHGERLMHMQQSELTRIARESQDPMEAVAAIRETFIRKMDVTPYDTQLFTLLAFLDDPKGAFGQVKTGEGKSTLIAMTAAFYAARGRFVDVITTTQTLAKRDQKKYAAFFGALGITSSHICVSNPDQIRLAAQVVYGTNTDFEFSLLRKQLAGEPERKRDVGIVDELDSIFLDLAMEEARISVPSSQDRSWIYKPYLEWIKTHAHLDDDDSDLKKYLGNDAALHITREELQKLFASGKRALELRENKDYYVKNQHIVLMDYINTGRPRKGCRIGGGVQEFLEAKHDLPIKEGLRSGASIAHTPYFIGYETLIGPTGTLGEPDERAELKALYKRPHFDVPPHRPSRRVQLAPQLCRDDEAYYKAVVEAVKAQHANRRPILILVQTIEDSFKMSQVLRGAKIEHQILNAIQQEEEEYLLNKAVQWDAVTVATCAAGRGSDFVLPHWIENVDGLHVIMGLFPANGRVKEQGIGRAARQGQKGFCQLIVNQQCPFVQELLTSSGREGASAVSWQELCELREQRVKFLSQERLKRADAAVGAYELFTDFSKLKKKVAKELAENPLECARYQEALTTMWADFYEKLEYRTMSRQRLFREYESFLETKVKPLLKGMFAYMTSFIAHADEEKKEE